MRALIFTRLFFRCAAVATSRSRVRPLSSGLYQSGVALITVLMVFAVGSILISKVVLQRSVDAQRVSAAIARAQASYYARVGEDLAILGLREEDTEDAKRTTPNDTLEEPWTSAPISFDVDSFSQIAIQIIDLERFYNLNNLREPDGRINDIELERFKGMLDELNLSEDLADNLADWLDRDDKVEGYNSESDSYLNRPLSYRAANTYMFDKKELLLVEGFTPEVYALIEPHVVALPIVEILPINVNTATPYALASLMHTPVSGNDVSIGSPRVNGILDERPYDDVADFNARSGLQNPVNISTAPSTLSGTSTINTQSGSSGGSSSSSSGSGGSSQSSNTSRTLRGHYAVWSKYFQINVRANYGGEVAYLTTVVKQEGNGSTSTYMVLSREEGDNSDRFLTAN